MDKEAPAEAALSGQRTRQRAAHPERELLGSSHCAPAKHHRQSQGPSPALCQGRPRQEPNTPTQVPGPQGGVSGDYMGA